MLEALADGGVMMGLPRDVATELAAQGTVTYRMESVCGKLAELTRDFKHVTYTTPLTSFGAYFFWIDFDYIVLQGAARMVLTTGAHPAAIKDSVTTPGGCTIAGLLTMEDGKIRSTLARTIQEAATVASTLGRDKK